MMNNDELRRECQKDMRMLVLKILEHLPWEGHTQKEILQMAEGLFKDPLGALYNWESTMFSRFLRTPTTKDPDTGMRVRSILRTSDGRYYRWETVRKDKSLLEDCMKVRDELTEEDVASRNRMAEDAERLTGKLYPRARIIMEQLDLGLFPPPPPPPPSDPEE